MKLKVKRPKTKRVLTDKQKQQRTERTMKWIVGKYKTGDLDLEKHSHFITARIAVSKGLIPKEVFEDEGF